MKYLITIILILTGCASAGPPPERTGTGTAIISNPTSKGYEVSLYNQHFISDGWGWVFKHYTDYRLEPNEVKELILDTGFYRVCFDAGFWSKENCFNDFLENGKEHQWSTDYQEKESAPPIKDILELLLSR